jgi:plastocyanin
MRRRLTLAVAVMAAIAFLVVAASPSLATTTKKVTITSSGVYGPFSFSPKAKSIGVGVRIKWTNATSTLHHIKFTNGKAWSKDVPVGSSVTRVFHHKGTFHYHCTIHHAMKGTITVT